MRYSASLPLYPPADRYVEAFGEAQLRHWLARRNIGGITLPLAVEYTPLPLSVSTLTNTPADGRYLASEIRLVGELLDARDRPRLAAAVNEPGQPQWPSDVIALGPGALGRVGPACYQNYPAPEQYRAALDAERLPVWRGIELTADDLARRAVIESHQRVSMEAVEIAHVLEFASYFAAELADLEALAGEGLVELRAGWIEITPRGRSAADAICAVFDRYLRERRQRESVGRIL